MTENYSRAKAIKTFIDRIKFPPRNNNKNEKVIDAIASSFNLKSDSSHMLLLLHAQVDNFERILFDIDVSNVSADAKEVYRNHVSQLSKLVKYPALYQSAEAARAEIVGPHLPTLTLLSDALRVYFKFDEPVRTELAHATENLEAVCKEISEGAIDDRLKEVVVPQLSGLIFLLKNCDVLGFDRAWQIASGAMMSAFAVAQGEVAQNRKSVLQKLAVSVAVVVGILASAEAGMKHVVSITSQAKGLYEFIAESERQSVPKIEYKKKE